MRAGILVLLFMVGCAAPSSKKSNSANMGAFGNGSYDSIKSDLTRSAMAYGYFYVEVFPYTEALLTAQGQSAASKLDANVDQQLKNDIKTLTKDATCLMFGVGALSIEGAKFKNLIAVLETSAGQKEQVNFLSKSGVDSVPSTHDLQGFNWSNYSMGCTKKVDLTKGFKVTFGSKIDTAAPTKEMVWSL